MTSSPRLAVLILCTAPLPSTSIAVVRPHLAPFTGQRAVAASAANLAARPQGLSCRMCAAPVPRSPQILAAVRAVAHALWPSTLTKFWGWHALSWGVALLSFAFAHRATAVVATGYAIALAAANFALAVLLYRNAEEAGVALSAAGCAYFAGTVALLRTAGAALGPPVTLRALRLWHVALAAGSAAFAIKASNKDRLFSHGGLTRRDGRGSALPLLVFVNRKSGAKQGARVASELLDEAARAEADGRTLRVVDLAEEPPEGALAAFGAEHGAYRVLVCGGDGTVAWVLGAVERLRYRPAVAVLPLGTGNDLSRVLGWGKAYREGKLQATLADLDGAQVALLDRWLARGRLPDGVTSRRMCNYLSIGVDAKAALLWTRLARAKPALFQLRLLNKLWYIICGAPEVVLHSFRDLSERCELYCDGERIEVPPSAEGLMVLNTLSYGGGSDLWDEERRAPLRTRLRRPVASLPTRAAMDDGVLEVVAVTDVVHLAAALGGFSNGMRVCQGRRVSVRIDGAGIPLQIDGEVFDTPPADAPPFSLTLERTDQAYMLAAPAAADAAPVALAVERALASGFISVAQRDGLLREVAGHSME